MSLFDFILGRKRTTAFVAKERLQIILAHERTNNQANDAPTWLPKLQQELMEVIARYIKIDINDLKVNLEKRDNIDLLEINVTLPDKEGVNVNPS